MNDREADKYVKKDNIWKKPDYDALIKNGVPVDVVYFIKKARDSLGASPSYYRTDNTPEKRLARQKQYIETIRQVQKAVEHITTRAEARQVCNDFFLGNGYLAFVNGGIGGGHFTATEKGRENPVITNKLLQTLYVRSDSAFERDFTRKAKKEQFGVSKEDKIPKGFDIHLYNGDGYSKRNDWKPGTYYVTKKYSILKTNLESYADALKWAQDFARQRNAGGKKRFVPQQLANVRRDGPDYRHGWDVTGQDYLDTFGFRGGEFGNWMSQNDRRASLNMGFDALKDLAAALQISEKDIAYQGTLSIAFGARGSGNAVAHYEPLRKVINLTKMRGAGSLAHEWWHGLDDYLGGKMGAKGFLSDQAHLYPPFQKLLDTIKYKPETPEQAAARIEKRDAQTRKNAESWLDSAMLSSLRYHGNEDSLERYAALKADFLSGKPGSLEQLNHLKKSVTGRVIPKSERDRLQIFENILVAMKAPQEQATGKTRTDYYQNSIRMGKECEKDGGYWDSNVELTARAFATYILDKLPERSDYLAGHAECALTIVFDKDGNSEILRAYPQGEERKAINAAFDEVIADLKLQHTLTHADKPQTLPEPALKSSADLPDVAWGEQLTLFSTDKPSLLGQLAASKEQNQRPPSSHKSHKKENQEL